MSTRDNLHSHVAQSVIAYDDKNFEIADVCHNKIPFSVALL